MVPTRRAVLHALRVRIPWVARCSCTCPRACIALHTRARSSSPEPSPRDGGVAVLRLADLQSSDREFCASCSQAAAGSAAGTRGVQERKHRRQTFDYVRAMPISLRGALAEHLQRQRGRGQSTDRGGPSSCSGWRRCGCWRMTSVSPEGSTSCCTPTPQVFPTAAAPPRKALF